MKFDISADPTERKNLINEPKYANDVAKLSQTLLTQLKKTSDPEASAFEATIAKP